MITTNLPEPNAAKRGNEFSELPANEYRYLQIGNNFVVYRSLTQQLSIKYTDGARYNFANQCSAIFENNTYLTPDGQLLWLYKQENQIYLNVFNTATRALVRSLYITTDAGFASLAIDRFLNRVIIYKSVVASGHSFIYAYTFTNAQLVAYHDSTTEVAPDTVLYLAFKENTTGFYRGLKNSDGSKLDHVSSGELSNQTYNTNPLAGANLVANTTSIYFPCYSAAVDILFTINSTMTQLAGWSSASPNTQVFSPVDIDARTDLFHAQGAPVGYPRVLLDTHTQIIYDTITQTRLKVSAPNIVTLAAEYPICENGLLDSYPLIGTIPDRQDMLTLSNNTKNAVIGRVPYKLDDANFCKILTPAAAKHIIFENNSDTPNVTTQTGLCVKEVARTGNPILITARRQVYELNGQLSFYSQNGLLAISTFSSPTGNKIGVLKSLTSDIYILRTNNALYKLSILISQLEEIPAPTFDGSCREAFIWNDKMYFRFDNGMTIVEPNLTTINHSQVNYARSGDVRLSPNFVTGELLLYDRATPSVIRKIITNLTFEDYTSTSFYSIGSVILSNELPIGTRAQFTSHNFAFRALNQVDLLFFNTENGSINLVDRSRHAYQLATTATQSYFNIGSEIKIFGGNYIAADFIYGLVSYTSQSLNFIDWGLIALEAEKDVQLGELGSPTKPAIWFTYLDNKLAFALFGSNAEKMFTFGSPGLRYNIGLDFNVFDLLKQHLFVIVYNTQVKYVSIDAIPEDGYTFELLADYSTQANNINTKVDIPNYQKNHTKYTAQYIVNEEQVTNILNAFTNQAEQSRNPDVRFEVYFFDVYLTSILYARAIFNEVSYEWHTENQYKLNMIFEVLWG